MNEIAKRRTHIILRLLGLFVVVEILLYFVVGTVLGPLSWIFMILHIVLNLPLYAAYSLGIGEGIFLRNTYEVFTATPTILGYAISTLFLIACGYIKGSKGK